MQFLTPVKSDRDGFRKWSGTQGLSQLRGVLRCTTADPGGFRAEVRQLSAAGVRLTEWRSTQLAGEWDPTEHPVGVELVLVLAGSLVFVSGDGRWEAGPQSLLVLRNGERRRWNLARGTHLRCLSVPSDLLPPAMRSRPALMDGILPRTKLAHAFSGLLQHGMDAAIDEDALPTQLAKSLHSLAMALLDELVPVEPVDDAQLRERILQHIDQHIAEPNLGPRSIANAFGVSLRWVHRSFNTEDMTIGRCIRIRRVDAVAEHLRHETRRPRLGMLAMQYGYSGRDQLARTFRWRFGTTVAEYQTAAALGSAPQPLTASELGVAA